MDPNWIDIGFSILALGGALVGYFSGILGQLGRLITLVVSVYMAFYFHPPVTRWLQPRMEEATAGMVSYLVIFIGVYLVLSLVLFLIDRALRKADLKRYDRLLGSAFGFLKGGLIGGVLLMGLAMYPNETIERDIKNSMVGIPVLNVMRNIHAFIPDALEEKIEETLERIKEESKQRLDEVTEEQKKDLSEDLMPGDGSTDGSTESAPENGSN